MDPNTIQLYIYDLSNGWCGNFGPLSPIKAIWHTSIVAFGKEYVFGAGGIMHHTPGEPLEIMDLGVTNLTATEFKIYIKGLKYSDFTASSYDPLEHNCNHFTAHVAKNLGFGGIPGYILESTDKLRNSPFYSKVVDMLTSNGKKRINQ